MAYDFLKKLFGTPKEGEEPKAMTYAELEAAIDGDKDISLVNLKAGGYVSKDKFDAKETELKGVQAQLASANEQIKSFEGQDIEGIKSKVSEWETKYNTDTQKLQEQLAAQERSHAEDMFMAGYQFTSKAARNGVLAELRAKDFKLENGELLGAKDFMTSLMENDEYKGAFKTESSGTNGNGGQGGNGGEGGNNGGGDNGGNGGNGGNGNQSGISTSGNIYTGQSQPRFSAGTNGGVGKDGNAPQFNFGFTHIREPETK